jgi:hypothetical protein
MNHKSSREYKSGYAACHYVFLVRGPISDLVDRWVTELAFILNFLNQFWIASSFLCSLCEAITGSLSVATTAVSSGKFAVIDFGEVCRSAVYNRP